MKIKKVKDTFNTLALEISYGQLVAIRNALEKDHADPLSDECYAEIEWYLQNTVPLPGEEEEDLKAERDEATKGPEEAGAEVGADNPGGPSSDAELEAGALPPPPAEEMGEPGEEGPEGGPGGEFQEGPKLSPEERDIIDRSLRGGPSARPSGLQYQQRGGGGLPPPPAE